MSCSTYDLPGIKILLKTTYFHSYNLPRKILGKNFQKKIPPFLSSLFYKPLQRSLNSKYVHSPVVLTREFSYICKIKVTEKTYNKVPNKPKGINIQITPTHSSRYTSGDSIERFIVLTLYERPYLENHFLVLKGETVDSPRGLVISCHLLSL